MIKYIPFIVVEGTDGSGKPTLCDWISEEFDFVKL
jgi:thymidylate kinase